MFDFPAYFKWPFRLLKYKFKSTKKDTEELDNDLFKDINSKSKFGLSKTLPAAILKKPNATASDSQKNISTLINI